MFLERKFSARALGDGPPDPALCSVLPGVDWGGFGPDVRDVLVNIQLLLKGRRRYDHILPDYGLDASEGHFGDDAQIEQIMVRLPKTLKRYEPRFLLQDLEFDVDDDNRSFITASGGIKGHEGTYSFTFGVVSRLILSLSFEPSVE